MSGPWEIRRDGPTVVGGIAMVDVQREGKTFAFFPIGKDEGGFVVVNERTAVVTGIADLFVEMMNSREGS